MKLVRQSALRVADLLGRPGAFLLAMLLTAAWLVWGLFDASAKAWLLVPSAVASVVTFLIVFSLQYTQNRDTRAIQLKLDEIIRASESARSELVKLERFSDEELGRIEGETIALRDEESAKESAQPGSR